VPSDDTSQNTDTPSHLAELTKQGIAAVKVGDREKGRALLLQVIEADERIEQAWLWLSSAVDTDEDRRICLENVLAINPNNAAAQRGLAKLGPAAVKPQPAADETIVRREHKPLTPAAAILYPDKQVTGSVLRSTTPPLTQVPAVEFTAASTYDDVWNSQKDLCAFCGHEIGETDERCPHCQQRLIGVTYRNPLPGANLHLLWVLLVGISQLSLFQLLYAIVAKAPAPSLALHAGVIVIMLILAAGVYFRQLWAFVAALAILPIVVILTLGEAIGNTALVNSITGFITNSPVGSTVVKAVVSPVMDLVVGGVKLIQVLTALGALLVGLLGASSDFERVRTRHLARLDAGLIDASQFHSHGQTYARQGMWASAILHWQRAAANAPTRAGYRRALGVAYARLGFYARSLDVLQAALSITAQPEAKAELERLIEEVRGQMGNG